MMRVCHLNTCPVGVATQDPELRKKFTGEPEHVVNFMRFIAQEVRELMAQLGFRTLNEMVGRTELPRDEAGGRALEGAGASTSRRSSTSPTSAPEVGRYCQIAQDHGLEESLDMTTLLPLCKPALERGEKVAATLPIRNVNRVVGTITRQRGHAPLRRRRACPTTRSSCTSQGSAGQSFGAFVPRGMTLTLEGDANDYVGKGLSGGKIIVYPAARTRPSSPRRTSSSATSRFYGATGGEAYIRGMAGERFCVRNSGVNAVVEGGGRPRLRVHDRRPGGRARADRAQLRRRHVGRHRLRARRRGGDVRRAAATRRWCSLGTLRRRRGDRGRCTS